MNAAALLNRLLMLKPMADELASRASKKPQALLAEAEECLLENSLERANWLMDQADQRLLADEVRKLTPRGLVWQVEPLLKNGNLDEALALVMS